MENDKSKMKRFERLVGAKDEVKRPKGPPVRSRGPTLLVSTYYTIVTKFKQMLFWDDWGRGGHGG